MQHNHRDAKKRKEKPQTHGWSVKAHIYKTSAHTLTPLSALQSCLNGAVLSRGWLSDSLLQLTAYLAVCIANTHKHRESITCARSHTRAGMTGQQMFSKVCKSAEGMTHTCLHNWEFDFEMTCWLSDFLCALWRRTSHIELDSDDLKTQHLIHVETVKWATKKHP